MVAADLNGSISAACPPIGTIAAYLKSYTNAPALPSGWKECDGSTVSDADSPFNGVAVPSLNAGNKYLRGNTTSGGTGGAAVHVHSASFTSGAGGGDYGCGTTSSDYARSHTHAMGTIATGSLNQEPPYYEVVWVIRIK